MNDDAQLVARFNADEQSEEAWVAGVSSEAAANSNSNIASSPSLSTGGVNLGFPLLDSFPVLNQLSAMRRGMMGRWARGDDQSIEAVEEVANAGGFRTPLRKRSNLFLTLNPDVPSPPPDGGGGGDPPSTPPPSNGGMNRAGFPLSSGRLGCYCKNGQPPMYKVNDYIVTTMTPIDNGAAAVTTDNIDYRCYTPTFSVVQLPSAGYDINQRIGRVIRSKALIIRGILEARVLPSKIGAGATGCYSPGRLRLVILYDKQANGALPSANNVFNYNGTNYDITALYNVDSKYRFIPLYDNTWTLGESYFGTGTAPKFGPVANNSIEVNIAIPLKNLKTVFNGGTGNIGDITTGSIVFCFLNTIDPYQKRYCLNSRLIFSDE